MVAVLVAMVATAATLEWRRRRAMPTVVAKITVAPQPREPPDGGAPGLLPAPPPVADASHGARMLHGDARHTARAAGLAPRTRPALAWSRDVGGPVEAQVVTSPDESIIRMVLFPVSATNKVTGPGTLGW